jgi:prophage regulatory protein
MRDTQEDLTQAVRPASGPSYEALRLIRIKEVMHIVGLGRTKIYALIKTGDFPAPRHIGKASLWVDSEVQEWVRSIAHRRWPVESKQLKKQ